MEDIETSTSVNRVAYESYFASRVEVFQREVNYPGLYYDVNSSFPYAMTFPLPGKLRANYSQIPQPVIENGYPYIADVEVMVPDCNMPTLPVRMGNRVFFPVGRWRGWYTGVDIELLKREGGKILRVHHCKVFEPFYDLREYANDLYARRAATSDPFEREFYKLLLNSVYGKFAEQSEKTSVIINPSVQQLKNLNRGSDELMPGVFFKTREVPIPHAHVPISSYITAIARRTLFDFMSQAAEVHYCDTDGFSVGIEDTFPTVSGLGGLKLEKSFESATFLVPKLYRWYPGSDKPPVVKAKGFSLSKDKWKANEQFEHLLEGGEVTVERMVRIRENFRNESTRPKDKKFPKRLRQLHFLQGIYKFDSLPKRFMYPDGTTRPWSYKELTNRGLTRHVE